MIRTRYGVFDGASWEELCQIVFKRKYKEYQEMVASPGDFGIEGFTKSSGLVFQCYCPNEEYTQKELYEKQRDKITKDLGKLRTYEDEIFRRMGNTKIKKWIFVTPKINDNKLLSHAQTKQQEVLEWGLSIIDSGFTVNLKDADFFAKEINEFQTIKGEKITLLSAPEMASNQEVDVTEYEENVNRKNKVRCTFDGVLDEGKFLRLNKLTIDKWLKCDVFLKDIERRVPDVYFHIVRVINQYESEIEEVCITWRGETEDLIAEVRAKLAQRIEEAVPYLGGAEIYRVADQVTSKWIALCPLGVE